VSARNFGLDLGLTVVADYTQETDVLNWEQILSIDTVRE